MILIFDIITNNPSKNIDILNLESSIVHKLSQLAWSEYNENGYLTSSSNYLIIPENNGINYNENTNGKLNS